MNNYLCTFMFPEKKHNGTWDDNAQHKTEIRTIFDIKDGFWVNDQLEYDPCGVDIKYWIPPSRVLYVLKINGE